MLEKVTPIPFIGKEISGVLYRTSAFLHEHPRKSGLFFVATAAFWIWYEANVVHKDSMPSPNVRNHLEYKLRVAEPMHPAEGRAAADAAAATAAAYASGARPRQTEAEILQTVTDPAKREELQGVFQREEEVAKANNTALVVRSGQLHVRQPYWTIRNNERNWSILARDQQQQKDHYWYRMDRSKDDDFARNTYSK